MTAITQALNSGYSVQKILKYLSETNPKLAQQITSALEAGHTTEHVLNFISRNEKKLARFAPEKEQVNKSSNLYKTAQHSIHPSLKGAANFALGATAAATGGVYALSRAIPTALRAAPGIGTEGQGLQQATGMQQNITQAANPLAQTSSLRQNPLQTQNQNQALNQASQQPPVNTTPVDTNLTPVANMAQPEVKTIDVANVLENLGSKKKVDELIKSGNDAEGVTAFFKKFHPKLAKDIEEKAGKDFENVIAEYLTKQPKEDEISPGKEPKVEESRPLEKKSTVASPQGIGEVLEVRNGQALIDVDGKKHKVPVDELIESPLPEKELADLYDDLISGIEKKSGQQVSRNVEWAGYDPINNELAYKPHGSDKLYAYDDISPEDVEELTSLLTQRKSTGQNYIGAWEAGTTSPIGAALHKLIMKLQASRGGKGNEYKNKYETIYDALELAKKAAKERHAERKKQAKKPRTY